MGGYTYRDNGKEDGNYFLVLRVSQNKGGTYNRGCLY